MTSVVHMQAPYAIVPTCSPGILIRLFGAEKYASRSIDDPYERNREVRDLQEKLSDYFFDLTGATGMSVSDACTFLAGSSGMDQSIFLGDEDRRGAFDLFPRSPEAGVSAWKPLVPVELRENPERIRPLETVGVYFSEE